MSLTFAKEPARRTTCLTTWLVTAELATFMDKRRCCGLHLPFCDEQVQRVEFMRRPAVPWSREKDRNLQPLDASNTGGLQEDGAEDRFSQGRQELQRADACLLGLLRPVQRHFDGPEPVAYPQESSPQSRPVPFSLEASKVNRQIPVKRAE